MERGLSIRQGIGTWCVCMDGVEGGAMREGEFSIFLRYDTCKGKLHPNVLFESCLVNESDQTPCKPLL